MGWSDKYKKSIDCSNPKGFSQRAHCQGKKKKMKESMNFTEFMESLEHPLYEAEGDVPRCPPGYKYDKSMKMCVPKSPKDAVGDRQKYADKDLKPGSGPGYNVFGSSGYDGTGYAFEEPPTAQDRGTGSTY